MNKEIIYINGHDLDIATVVKAVSSKNVEVKLEDKARAFCTQTRNQVDKWLTGDAPVVYGINTGLGNMKDTALPPEEHIRWNKTIPYPHAVNIGNPLDENITRATLLIRANVLARAYSAVRPALIDRYLAIFNSGVAPVMHELGSTGLSDLAPLAEMAMFIAGFKESQAIYNGKIINAQEAFKKTGLAETFEFECKEVLASMNGSTVTQANSVLTYDKFEKLFDSISGKMKEDDENLYQSMTNTMEFMKFNLNKENNVSCDNPTLFDDQNGGFEPVMGCNCSNTQIGYVMDLVPVITADIAKFIYKNCTDDAIEKVASIVTLIDQLAIPATADNIATKAGQEDHVEFSYGAARKARKATELLENIIV